MLDRLRTVGLVVIVTMLIWLWAEAESLSTQFVSPRVVFAGSDDIAVKVLDPGASWNGTVRVRLQGASTALDRAQRMLATALELRPGVGVVPAAPGEHTIDLREALRLSPSFRKLGVTVAEVDPPTARIALDPFTTLELPVRPVLTGVELDGEPVVQPGVATVRLARSIADRLGSDAAVIATPDAEALSRLRDDAPQALKVRLTFPESAGSAATITPPTAQVVVRLRSGVEAWTVKNVPVWVTIPNAESGRYDVRVLDETLPEVTVTGPREAVRGLRERAEPLIATVALTREELEKNVVTKGVTFAGTPAGVSCSPSLGAVRLRITRRPESGN